jgi:nucleoside-diphosphate-sugar epimerase
MKFIYVTIMSVVKWIVLLMTYLSLGGSRFIEADLTNENDINKLDDDYDVIFHLAAINGTENFYNIPYTVMEVAIKSTMLLLEKYKDTKNKVCIYFLIGSLCRIYPER